MSSWCRELTLAFLVAWTGLSASIAELLRMAVPYPDSLSAALIGFFALAIGHAFADFALQSQFMAQNKNRHLVPKDTDTGKPSSMWIHVLTAHCLVHAGIVWIILAPLTPNAWAFALVEFVVHWVIDFVKCEGKTGFNADQGLHYLCKAGYLAALACYC
jgi:hypothetical protein